MITLYRAAYQVEPRAPEFAGISTEAKPTEISGKPLNNGATFIEIDTGALYRYSAENSTWYEQ